MLGALVGSALAWAKAQFGGALLGDPRRASRAVKVATSMAESGTRNVPFEAKTFGEAKAAYRLFDAEEVTHAAITQPHRDQTIAAAREAEGPMFFIHDDTLLDFSHRHSLTGLGPIGNGLGRGFIVHSCLVAQPGGEVLGLAHQIVWTRAEKAQKKARSKQNRAKKALAKKKIRSKRIRSQQPAERTEAAVWEEAVINLPIIVAIYAAAC